MTTTKVVRKSGNGRDKQGKEKEAETVHPLSYLIPDEWYAEEYVSRKVAAIPDVRILDEARKECINVILRGPTGSAKTSLVYAYGAGGYDTKTVKNDEGADTNEVLVDRKRARPVVYIPCNGALEPSQLIGRWVPKPKGGYRFVPGLIIMACLYGGIIYIDEANFMPPKMGAILHGLLDKRRVIVVLDAAGSGLCGNCGTTNDVGDDDIAGIPPDCIECGEPVQSITFEASEETQVIAAYNPDYEGTVPLNEAFLNRFPIQLNWPYDSTVEAELINSPRLLMVAQQLRSSAEQGVIETPVSTNMLMQFEQFAFNPSLGFGFAVEMFLNAFRPEEKQAVLTVMKANAPEIEKELEEYEYE